MSSQLELQQVGKSENATVTGCGGLVQVPYILSGVNSGQASKERKLKHLEMYLFEKRFKRKNMLMVT